MSLSNDRSTVARIQKEVADLQRKQGDEATKVADATKKMNAAVASANKATSPSTAKSYLSTAERESRNVEAAQDKQARIATDIARKMGDLTRAQERVLSGEEKERKDQAAAYEKQRKLDASSMKALQVNNDRLSRDLASLAAQMTAAIDKQASQAIPFAVENADGSSEPYDFFISHAWKDKPDFVDGLALKAEAAGLSVWYDRQALRWGDSIRQKIDEGLRQYVPSG